MHRKIVLTQLASFAVVLAFVGLLFYSRFVGLSWGLPYPMHPDERNMADALVRMSTSFSQSCRGPWQQFADCLNPDFFAYGQLSLYLGLLVGWMVHVVSSLVHAAASPIPRIINFSEAVMGLRIVSAIASVITAYVLIKIFTRCVGLREMKGTGRILTLASILPLIFSPLFIQFSHFGTTESLLMLGYTLILVMVINYQDRPRINTIVWLGIISGGMMAIKVSALLFVGLPLIGFVIAAFHKNKPHLQSVRSVVRSIGVFTIICLLTALIFSPHSLLHWADFMTSMAYETAVGNGALRVFYTRQFEFSLPIIFQFLNIFPHVMGMPLFIISILGFIFLPWKNQEINLIRLAFVIFFLPSAFLFAKWTRFIAPAFPMLGLLGVMMMASIMKNVLNSSKNSQQNKIKPFLKWLMVCIAALTIFGTSLPGLSYITIYTQPDVRFTASDWMVRHLPSESHIFSETANVVDLPISPPTNFYSDSLQPPQILPTYGFVSFNLYDLETDPSLQGQYPILMETADYVVVPSRRVFANHTCLWPNDSNLKSSSKSNLKSNSKINMPEFLSGYSSERCENLAIQYPLIHKYYEDVLDPSQFTLIKQFSAHPRIELFGQTLISFPDEHAEETWSVFDHPVIRIYKKL